jgi:hypothetical protein
MTHNRPQTLIRPNARDGSLPDIATRPRDVRSCRESGHSPKDFELNRIMSDVVRIVESRADNVA